MANSSQLDTAMMKKKKLCIRPTNEVSRKLEAEIDFGETEKRILKLLCNQEIQKTSPVGHIVLPLTDIKIARINYEYDKKENAIDLVEMVITELPAQITLTKKTTTIKRVGIILREDSFMEKFLASLFAGLMVVVLLNINTCMVQNISKDEDKTTPVIMSDVVVNNEGDEVSSP